ncbi:MAG: hypothetical protein QOE98_2083, partial [Gaiellaceae bacterium]|nr:hypothetical protein [Gaiellaceae bacterium]
FWVVSIAIAALGGGMITAFKLARWL